MDAQAIAATLLARVYRWMDEYGLQDQIEQVLTEAGAVGVEREVEVGPRCRIDLVVARVGIEVKVKGAPADVARQLQRYAATGRFDAFVLATTVHAHRGMPETLGGVPVHVAYLAKPF
jgi:hypothetical protein